jgi:hypothetical protein
MKKEKKKTSSGFAITGLGNARIVSRGDRVTLDGVDANIEQVSVLVDNRSPQVRLRNVNRNSVITVNGKRVN